MAALPPSEPSATMLNLAALAYLLGISIVTWCIARTTEHLAIWSRKTWFDMPWVRLCLLLVLIDSWVYLCLTGVVLYGSSPSRHDMIRCSVAIFVCINSYGASKVFIYLCLIERVHAVWSKGRKRCRSPVYIICLVLLVPVFVISGFTIANAVRYLYNGYCVIGVGGPVAISMLTYDLCTNFFLTMMFVIPLARSTIHSARLKNLAIRASVASSVALMTSVINVTILFTLHQGEMIWVCLASCGADLVVNAAALYWAIQGASPSAGPQDQSIHFSTLPRVAAHQLENGDILGVNTGYGSSMSSQSVASTCLRTDKDYLSFSAIETQSTFKKPEKAARNTHHISRLEQEQCASLSTVGSATGELPSCNQQIDTSQQGTIPERENKL
ncbi:hypothetical protein CTheo_6059 [Ceratobasidium theobromae]|uniref:Transmembrane protein n=1 Tax=Ceratobasidium theobromae TaxID=1582974 RepID=A0A5N5QFJ7_9AGAM|nr:hypothetical protein CTheo_6059 [Ceratobasidium theobromae]